MSTRFVLRVQPRPSRSPDETAQRLVSIARDCSADEIMLFAFAEEWSPGHPSLPTVCRWIEHTAPAREALHAAGVDVSFNPWQTILHEDRGRDLLPDQRWRRMVDPQGRTARAIVCPLDPDWRSYLAESFALYGAAERSTVWVEDDIRLHNHRPLAWGGCFCPAHLAEFGRRIGQQVSREELVTVATASGPPHPWRSAWLDMWDETQREVISELRNAVEQNGSRLGLMSSLIAQHSAEGRDWPAWWDALSSGTVVHRPHFFGYSSVLPAQFVHGVTLLEHNRALQPDGVASYPELEHAPYGRWNKSYREQFAQMALAHVLGSTGLAISAHHWLDNDPSSVSGRAQFLTRSRPALDLLAGHFPMDLTTTGVSIAWTPDVARHRRLAPDGAGAWSSLAGSFGGFGDWLLAAGVSVTYRGATEVVALDGPAAAAEDDERIEELLRGAVLLDGPATVALAERGIGDLIGLTDVRQVTQDELPYSIEHTTHAAFGLRPDSELSVNQGSSRPFTRVLRHARPLPGAVVATELRDAAATPLGPGLVLFENRHGGRVASVPWSANDGVVMNEERAAQLQLVVTWLGSTALRTSGHPWLTPILLESAERWSAAIWNAGPDDASGFDLSLPDRLAAPDAVIHVGADGRQRRADLRDEHVSTTESFRQWDCVILTGAKAVPTTHHDQRGDADR